MNPTSSELAGVRFLVELRRRGMTILPEGARLRVTPKSALTPELRSTLVARRGEVLAALSFESRILQMPLDRFEREGRSLEIRVPWLPETLWFVPGKKQLKTLTDRGISRGRIWTARELLFLWGIPSLDHTAVEKLGRIKAELGGEFVSLEGPDQGSSLDA